MITKELEIINKLGLHARAAAKFVNTANRFEADISVTRNGRTINGKSIMGLMMLAAAQGSHISVSINGTDEQQAMQSLADLISQRFKEDQ